MGVSSKVVCYFALVKVSSAVCERDVFYIGRLCQLKCMQNAKSRLGSAVQSTLERVV